MVHTGSQDAAFALRDVKPITLLDMALRISLTSLYKEMAGHHGIKPTTSSGGSLTNSWHRGERRVLLESAWMEFDGIRNSERACLDFTQY